MPSDRKTTPYNTGHGADQISTSPEIAGGRQMLRTVTATGIVMLGILPVAAQAQPLSRYRSVLDRRISRPTISPYLNLLRRNGGGIGFQYYRRVLPEREFRAANRQQSQALRNLNRQVEQINQPTSKSLGGGLGTTGHSTTFQNYGGYFGGAGQAGGLRVGRR